MIGNIRSMVWRSGLMCLLGTACTVLLMGCGSKTPTGTPATGTPAPKGNAAGQTAPAAVTSEPADAAGDSADGDTQVGEFEGEHQFGANDEADAKGIELKAVLSNAGFEATIGYSLEPKGASFEVVVAGGTPNAAVDVMVNDLVVQTITLDSNGAANAEFSSAPDEPGQLQLPADFPTLVAGDVVSAAGVSSPLADDAGADNGPNDEIEDGTNDGESD